jgi:hypothetical protein
VLDYLTVFRSRLGIANLVLPLVSLSATRSEATLRKLRELLSKTVDIDVGDPQAGRLVDYLTEKQLIGARPRRSGRYTRYLLTTEDGHWIARSTSGSVLPTLPVYQTDVWFSDSRVRSTVGVPTPDNTDEVYEFCLSLGLISKVKGSRTTAGQTVATLRKISPFLDDPFVLGLETTGLLRQIIERDALILCELMRELSSCETNFRRDDLLPDRFIAIAQRAYEFARASQLPPEDIKQARSFVRLLEETAAKKARRQNRSDNKTRSTAAGPGVLEHRLSPRLEWLTDVGILTKEGLPKNAFSYRQTPLVADFLSQLESYRNRSVTSDDVSLSISAQDPQWAAQRQGMLVDSMEQALVAGYRNIQMSIGPVAIRELCFLAAIHLEPIPKVGVLLDHLLQWAQREQGIRLSGGRYRREPEMVHFSDRVLS